MNCQQTFHPWLALVQAAWNLQNDPPRQRPGLSPSVLMAAEAEKRRLKGRIAEGSAVDAAARVLVYIGKAQHRIEERTFDALRKLLLAYPEVAEAEFKAAVREQWAILAVDERAAIEAVPSCPADHCPPGLLRFRSSAVADRQAQRGWATSIDGFGFACH
jgi:hypothetical protein